MSDASVPPWLQEQLAKYDQMRQTLQSVMAQKQQLQAELSDTERALTELKKATNETPTYKIAGSVLIKVDRDSLLKEMEEKKELTNTRVMVLEKQEQRLQASLQELQNRITESLKAKQPSANQGTPG
ncbi:MAG: prefoldin subunit beta [Nitrososphaerota archaeon]|jgi:prefoldin beta subunit|nr:prefoldin subunit beta [Nitrososphaerota archaeon]